MFISIDEVTDWRDLQKKVQQFFSELGYHSEVEAEVSLANGAKSVVDVLATKGKSALAQKILIECKYWKENINRAIVQSFKMDVQEAGANFGLIISKKGFQTGCYEGVELTTVKLLTFEELQKNLAEEWFDFNIKPLIHLSNYLIDKERYLRVGTIENDYFKSTLFNERLKNLEMPLNTLTRFSLSIFKEYRELFNNDVLFRWDHPIEEEISFLTGENNVKIKYDNARSFAYQMKSLFEKVLTLWNDYYKIYEEELKKLSPEEMAKVLFSK